MINNNNNNKINLTINETMNFFIKFQDIIKEVNTINNKPNFKEHIYKLYVFGKEWISNKNMSNLTTEDIMKLTTHLMSVIQTIQYQEQIKDADKGLYKKLLVETVIRILLNEYGIFVPEGMTIDNITEFTIKYLIPGVIETTLEVVSGHVNIKKTIERVSGCIGFCKNKKMCVKS